MVIESTGNVVNIGNCVSTYVPPTPEDLGVTAHYDASKPENVSIIAPDFVATWFDISGNGLHVTKNFAPRPRYNVTQINGLPTIDMNLSYLAIASSTLRILGDITIFVVAKFANLDSVQYLLDCSEGPAELSAYNELYSIYASSDKLLRTYHEYGEGVNQSWTTDIAVNDPSDSLVMFQRDTTAKSWRYDYRSSLQNITRNQTYTTNPDNGSVSDFTIGASGSSEPTTLFKGDIGEIMIFNKKLTEQEIAHMKVYINNKWGI